MSLFDRVAGRIYPAAQIVIKAANRLPFSLQRFIPFTAANQRAKIDRLFLSPGHAPDIPAKSKVLFWVPGGMPLMLQLEAGIATAMRLRGIDVHLVICDGPFTACMKREIKNPLPVNRWGESCGECRLQTRAVLDSFGVPYSFLGDYVSDEKRKILRESGLRQTWSSLPEFEYAGISLGKNVKSAAIRYLQGEPLAGHEAIVPEYACSALICAEAAQRAFDQHRPDRIFTSHGTYVDWGPALSVALARKIPVAAWMSSFLKTRFYFRHIEDAKHIDFNNMSAQAWKEVKRREIKPSHLARVNRFLENRYHQRTSFDMPHLKKYSGQQSALKKQLIAFPDKPVWAIFAHISWDAVCDYSPMAYENFDDWMIDTIKEIQRITDVNWLIKIHPSEAWDKPALGVGEMIRRIFPDLASHVRVVPADADINPLEFMEILDGGVTAYGTSGLELALLGKPVILSGEAHYGGKGFTYDGLSPDAYKTHLRRAAALSPVNDDQLSLARKYAYSYFVERMVPLPVLRNDHSAWWFFQYDQAERLLPGKDSFTDFVIQRIMDGKDFIMNEDLVAETEKLGWT